MNVLLTISVLLGHALACYGWGRGLCASLRLRTDNPAVTIALGLATVLAIGGFCNLAGVAFAATLWAIAGLGVVLALYALRDTAESRVPAGLMVAAVCLSVLVCVLVVSTLVPPWAFNFHDDYQKYFAHPARMLQTGSLSGSSGSALGFETLGGQAFLHGFALSFGRIDVLNAVDLGFAWPLCIALSGLGACTNGLQIALRVIAMLFVVTLDPQIVNVSATFTGCALCLAWIEMGRSQELQTSDELRSHACASGLLFAGLCALKTTYFLLSIELFGLTVCALWARVGARRAFVWAATGAAAWLLMLLPWFAVHAKVYLAAGEGFPLLNTLVRPYRVDPLSLDHALYGDDSFAMYTFAVAVCALLALYAWFSSPLRPWAAYLALICGLCLVVTYLTMLYIVAPASAGIVTVMRFFAPILIALATGCVTLTAQHARAGLAPMLLAVAICVPFVRGVATRFGEALRSGSILAFPYLAENTNYLRYNYDVLYGDFAKRTALAQAAVPVGVPLTAFINTPFWLDFKRNQVADIETAGLAAPWARIPQAAYVLWEYNGFGTTQLRGYEHALNTPGLLQARIGDIGLRLTHVLIELSRSSTSKVLYNDGHTLVLKLPTSSTLADAFGATKPTR